MNWVDFLIIIVLLLFLIDGYKKSFSLQLIGFLSFLLALLLSFRFYNLFSQLLQNLIHLPFSVANVAAFILVWAFLELVLYLIFHFLVVSFKYTLKIDSAFSVFSPLPSFLRGLVFISIFLILVATFPFSPNLKLTIQKSKIGALILTKTHQLELPLKNVFGGISQDSLNFFTIEPQAHETVDLGFKTNQFFRNQNLENQMINLVNKERTSRGLDALSDAPKLQQIALSHSSDMFIHGYFSHYSQTGDSVANRADAAGINYSVIGENLAYAPDLLSAHTGLMNSLGHRANILSTDFRKIGVGIEDGGVYGLMITQVFSN